MPTDLYGIGIVPIVIGVVQVLKETGLSSRFAPMVALLLGVVAGVGTEYQNIHPILMHGIVVGVAIGLAASGLYSGVAKFVTPKV